MVNIAKPTTAQNARIWIATQTTFTLAYAILSANFILSWGYKKIISTEKKNFAWTKLLYVTAEEISNIGRDGNNTSVSQLYSTHYKLRTNFVIINNMLTL